MDSLYERFNDNSSDGSASPYAASATDNGNQFSSMDLPIANPDGANGKHFDMTHIEASEDNNTAEKRVLDSPLIERQKNDGKGSAKFYIASEVASVSSQLQSPLLQSTASEDTIIRPAHRLNPTSSPGIPENISRTAYGVHCRSLTPQGQLEDEIEALHFREESMREVKVPSLTRRLCCCLPYALRNNRRLLAFVCSTLIIVSCTLAVLFTCQDISISVDANDPVVYHEKDQKFSSALQISVENPNFLPIRVEELNFSTFFYDDDGDSWFELDRNYIVDSARGSVIPLKGIVRFPLGFEYQWRIPRIGHVLAGQCRFRKRITLAFHGNADLRYIGRRFPNFHWGTKGKVLNCTRLVDEYDSIEYIQKIHESEHGAL